MARVSPTDEEILAQLRAARARARYHRKTRPHAQSAQFDRRTGTIRLVLMNGVEIALPLALFPELAGASTAELSDIELLGSGGGLNWERLDVQYSVPALIREALGPWVLMQAAGSAGGRVRSKAKTVAARENGKKGGRPRKRHTATDS